VIKFLNAEKVYPPEIHTQIVEVYEGAMNEGNVRKRCGLFKDGRTNVHEKEQHGPAGFVHR
jgi:hypothetical protein